jgi:SAM-dependent methyltransferase
MADASASTEAGRRPVIYAGRFIDQIADVDLPDDCLVLSEQDALPHKLTGVLDRASTLVFLDLPSFPIEAMTGDHWDVPVVVVLPPSFDAESLTTTLGSALFERLGIFDRIVTPDLELWEELRRKYRWAEGQRVPVTSDQPNDVARAVLALLEAESASPTTPEAEGSSGKRLHRVQAAALEPRFAAARGDSDTDSPLDVLEVGAGAGRWASSFDPTKTRFVGLDAHEDLVGAARANFPEQRFDLVGSDLLFPYEDESFDLVFSVRAMHHNPAPAKRTLLSEMWRVTRPGGRLLFLEDFVFTRRPEEPVIHPMSVTEFVDLILDAMAAQVVLEHVESLRYPGEDLRRGGLISLLRLGVPRTQ